MLPQPDDIENPANAGNSSVPRSPAPATSTTPLEAIAAACRQCMFDPLEKTTWREQIEACPCDRCPLHEHRPRVTGAGR